MTQPPIYVLNGPNLNMLGVREPDVYGDATLEDVRALCEGRAKALGRSIAFHQSNAESALIDWIHQAAHARAPVIINPAAYGHTSIALHDALKIVDAPIVEVHISNPARRDAFRAHSFVSSVADAVISGAGVHGYALALEAVHQLCQKRSAR